MLRSYKIVSLHLRQLSLLVAPVLLATAALCAIFQMPSPADAGTASATNLAGLADPSLAKAGQPSTLQPGPAELAAGIGNPFELAWWSPVPDGAQTVAWGDYDGDGDLDLAVGTRCEDTSDCSRSFTRLYRNGGIVGGQPQMELVWTSAPSANTTSLAWGDVDGDGDLDLAVGNDYVADLPEYGRPNWLYRNDKGALTATPVYTFSASGFTQDLAWGDYDGDGKLDLAVVEDNGNPVRLYHNDSAGGVITLSYAWQSSENVWGKPARVIWADWDNDGDLDLTRADSASPICLYRNDGGTLTTNVVATVPISRTKSIAWGDYDQDGKLDLALGNSCTTVPVLTCSPSQIYHNNGVVAGVPQLTLVWSSAITENTASIAWGDYDGDGDLDLALGNAGQSNRIYRNDGLVGNVPQMTSAWSSPLAEMTRNVVWGDMNGDGALDLVVGNENQPTRLYLNMGGTLGASAAWRSDITEDEVEEIAWGDYNGDGELDLAVSSSGNPVYLYRNDGGTLTARPVFSTTETGGGCLAWGDYDSDGNLDLASCSNRILLYHNNGGVLSANAVYSTAINYVTAIAWGDYDRDGYLDLAAGAYGQPVWLYHNNGGALSASPVYSSAAKYFVTSLAWGDVDNDGDPDLAVGTEQMGSSASPNVLFRNDRGVLTPSPVYSMTKTGYTSSLAWADVDGDGDLDLAAGSDGQPSRLYRNDDGLLTRDAVWTSAEADWTTSLAWGDYDGDGDLDLAIGNAGPWDLFHFYHVGGPNRIYRNDNGTLSTSAAWSSAESDVTNGVAWGDVDGDGDLDLVAGNDGDPLRLYRNGRDQRMFLGSTPTVRVIQPPPNAGPYSSARIWSGLVPMTYTLADSQGDPVRSIRAWYSPDGGGKWYTATPASGTQTTSFPIAYFNTTPLTLPVGTTAITSTIVISSPSSIADLDVTLNITHTYDWDLVVTLVAPSGQSVVLINQRGGTGDGFINTVLDDEAGTPIVSGTAPFHGYFRPEQPLSVLDNQPISGTWKLIIRDMYPPADGGRLNSWALNFKPIYTYTWDTVASGFFGQSDNVVFRIQAVPAITYTHNGLPGPYLYGAYATSTFPFRVRGTQVRVIEQWFRPFPTPQWLILPQADALVYRLPAGQTLGGAPIGDSAGQPFHTDGQGYLQGRGQLDISDTLLALVPITWTDSYTLYYTSGTPTLTGVDAYTVTSSGVQTLTVSALHPLVLFNLDLSLEWDAHNDAPYLEQLQFNLHRASESLYDFTNGQAALGHVNIFQNGDEWVYAHVNVAANNRLRPFANQGGIVSMDTLDPQHNIPTDTIRYSPGQVTIGSAWNRYGTPGQSLGEDWPIILAHELSHYLFFEDDTYLGLNANSQLIAVNTCQGSAMGDLYTDPTASEFIADAAYWQANCSNTLANQTLRRTEWQTLQLWYPALITPTTVLSGPTTMPFDFTDVTVHRPYTPTNPLADPTFYLDYYGGQVSSSEARAYLMRDDQFVINLGGPFGGQNRLIARGAQPGDRLCVFDRPFGQFGCEVIETSDDRLTLRQDTTWNPVLQLRPVNTTTFALTLTNAAPLAYPVRARLFPDLGMSEAPVTLVLNGSVYFGLFTTAFPALSGNVQVWVDEPATEDVPRRESIIAYSVGGNPGNARGGGGNARGGGGNARGGGGNARGGGGNARGGGAPLVSPDGQMIFFAPNPIEFVTGTLFTIQSMAGLPPLPPGRTPIGQGYSLAASPGASLPAGSVSIQYLSNDVLTANANEDDLGLYFWNGLEWRTLDTTLDTYFNLASAPSQGQGVYALMASVKIPLLGPGWNNFAYPVKQTQTVTEALLSISGYYTTVYGYDPSDAANLWKVYDVRVPPPWGWVNDLHVLEFGKGYWINVSDSITLHLKSGGSSAAAQQLAGLSLPLPPTMLYGTLTVNGAPAPDGAVLRAWTGGTLRTETTIRTMGDQAGVYVLEVPGDDPNTPGVIEGGRPGDEIMLTVNMNGSVRVLTPTPTWDIGAVIQLNLQDKKFPIYLPVIMRR